MKALVLAAGRSKRMKPIEDKNFLEFLGRPLLLWQVEMVKNAGFKEIVIVGGEHNLEKVRELFDGFEGAEVEVVEQENLDAGMCGAVLAGREKIQNEPMLIFSSNDVVDESAFELIKAAFEQGNAQSYVLGKKVEKYFPGGYLEVDEGGMIKNVVEKPGEGNEPSDMVNLVVHLHAESAKLFEYLEKAKSDADDKYEVALSQMIADGVKMQAVSYEGFWQPIKYPWHVNAVFKYFFEKAKKTVAKSAKISEKATVRGDVIIGENVKIFDNAVVQGPCYIGDNTVIANNALVRESHIGRDCVIGFSSEVARSFLGNEVWTHSNYIGDSILGNNVSFGAGAVTGNLRLDERNVVVDGVDSGTNKLGLTCGDNIRVGVNTSLMPGIKIGSGSFIGAGIVVAQDIPAKSFVRGSWDLKISENKESILKDRENFRKKL